MAFYKCFYLLTYNNSHKDNKNDNSCELQNHDIFRKTE